MKELTTGMANTDLIVVLSQKMVTCYSSKDCITENEGVVPKF